MQEVLNELNQPDISLHFNVKQRSSEWFAVRKRITASQLGFLIFCNTEEEKIQAARYMLGLDKKTFTQEQTDNMNIGTEYEDTLRQNYSSKIGQTIYETGFFINRRFPFLGGSPDGVLQNGDIVEFKITSKDVPKNYTDDFSEIPRYYLYQMYLNMYNIGSHNCHYVAYSRKSGEIYQRIVPFDYDRFRNEILIPCINFYNNYMIPFMEENKIQCLYENFE